MANIKHLLRYFSLHQNGEPTSNAIPRAASTAKKVKPEVTEDKHRLVWQSERNEAAAISLQDDSSVYLPLIPTAAPPVEASTCMRHAHTYASNPLYILISSAAACNADFSAVTSIIFLLFFLLSSSVNFPPPTRPLSLPCAVCQGDSDRSSIHSHFSKGFFLLAIYAQCLCREWISVETPRYFMGFGPHSYQIWVKQKRDYCCRLP